ncbi:metallophosphoesterase family protein [Peptostreptococcus equinus]|uniref:Phosphoesterase n=1 Tax=Peptostreptococcus equinus TaxID=3003601 RepID=A0ABY7JQS6_9FIRM|nr:metallophosphoesterase [Peptostreptococcus sp. CBA3647]WAW15231.1 metallophosphoesterase [Peptostreptococcus sp. CBA3647]
MRILVISDTHSAKKLMDKLKVKLAGNIDMIIHAGDHFEDSIYLKSILNVPVMAVVGNCDFNTAEKELDFELEGINIFLTHGHKYGVKSSDDLIVQRAKKVNAKIAIYGHTHIKEDKEIEGVRVINPGSLTLPRDGCKGSYVILEVENGKFAYYFDTL